MRPTLLNFRSPKEKTPDYYDVKTTHQGEKLNFRSKSLNKKQSNLPQANRFPISDYSQGIHGNNSFLGPGSYNDHETFIKLSQVPCCLKMVRLTALPPHESGNPCYIMVGNNVVYESSFLSTRQEKKDLIDLNADKSSVNLGSTFKKRAISTIKERLKAQQSSVREDSYQDQDLSVSTNTKMYPEFQTSQRPMTTENTRVKLHQTLPKGNWNSSISTKVSITVKQGNDKSPSAAQSSMNSNAEKSTMMEMTSAPNLTQINEETQEAKGGNIQAKGLSLENQVRVKSMLPKTANNFFKMKKGLYLNPLLGHPFKVKEEALQRSLNILEAYGEILPQLGRFQKNPRGSSVKPSQKRQNLLNLTQLQAYDSEYMKVIRDSPRMNKKREDLEKLKRDILNMNLDSLSKRKNNNLELNKYLSQRQSEVSFNL